MQPTLIIKPTTVRRDMPFLARLRELRLRAGLTQADLADMTGLGRTTINRLENGDPNSRPTTQRKLARALHVKVTDLWGEEPTD
jgi:DNA-binding XRE family transcriptional regulator